MKMLVRVSCSIYDALVSLHSDSLQFRYGEEMKAVFRELIVDAAQQGFRVVAHVWVTVGFKTIGLLAPAYALKGNYRQSS
jgi:hypothetical protein